MRWLIFLTLYSQILFAQTNSTFLEFYPLDIDNYWEYERINAYWDEWWILNYDTSYYSITVIGDTLLANGKTYKTLHIRTVRDTIEFTHRSFERIDSISGNVFRNIGHSTLLECLIDSLKAEIGDTSRADRTPFGCEVRKINVFIKDTLENVFGSVKNVKYFESIVDELHPFRYSLIQNIGLFEISWSYDFGLTSDNLIYAELNNEKYGESIFLSIDDFSDFPSSFILYQNYPNPFNSTTIISFSLARTQRVLLELYDLSGKKIKTLVNDKLNSGVHYSRVDGNKLASGIYFYILSTENEHSVKKCIFIK